MTSRTKALFLLVAIVVLGAAGVFWWRTHRAQIVTAPKPANAPSAIVAAPMTAPTTPSVPVSSPPNSSPVAALPPAATPPATIANPPNPATETPSTAAAARSPTVPTAKPPADATSTDRTTPTVAQTMTIGHPPPRIDEVTATERMVDAHATLRKPEVANPDSAGNRQILQTMLSKALLRANGTDASTAVAPK